MIEAMDQDIEASTEPNLARRGFSLAPWMIWSIAALHIVLWIIVALGYSWPEIAGGGNAAIPDFIESPISNPVADNDLDARMLAAQEAMAGFASWMYLLGVLTMLTTLGGTVALIQQIRLTRVAVDQGKQSAESSAEATKMQLRAYGDISVVPNHNHSDKVTGFLITVYNTGKTPLLDGWLEIVVLDEPASTDDDIIGQFNFACTMGPSNSKAYEFDEDMITKEYLPGYFSSDHPIVVSVELDYADVFGDRHTTQLNYHRFDSRSKLQLYPAGNAFT